MIDRIDIDALLIGALYGELTPADEARLTAHLESHPADRTALADLTHTREAVRESRVLTAQLEPPPSVSARLLQEAARRAPKPAREAAGWFHRFTRSFLMHPAMAAAAMLVLVVGVAGTLYVRHGDQFAETAAPVATADQVPTQNAAPSLPAPATVTAAAETGRADDSKPTGAVGNAGSAAGSDGYRVDLDEPAELRKMAAQDEQQAPVGRARDSKNFVVDNDGKDEGNEAKRGGKQDRALEPPAKPEVSVPKPAKLAKKSVIADVGIDLRSPEMQPKDFDNETADRSEKADKKGGARRELDRVDAADQVAKAPGAATAGGGAATAAPGMISPQNHAAPSDPAAAPVAAPGAGAPSSPSPSSSPSNGAKLKTSAKTASRPIPAQSQAPSPAPPPAAIAAEPPGPQRDNLRQAGKPASTTVDAKLAEEDKPADDKALIDWAQKQRDQVLAFVKSNNCRAAANAAVAIYNRAPDYYAANIATDRSIKPCIAYVNDVRERADRSRAASKRVNAADTPAQAAPPARK